ncbi:MAG: phosphotransferase family protein [Actinomycetota bacterium]|nr:phosphotransferase family protein [Actinomycetota bacterium]
MSDLDQPGDEGASAEGTGHPGRPEGIDVRRVSAWFAANIPGVSLPLRFELIAGGRSNLTYRVIDDAGLIDVLRRPPTGHLLPTAHDMGREHRIIAAMGPAGVPVPSALGLCTDTEVTGAPFYVMDFADGYVLRNEEEVVAALDELTRGVAARSLIDTLAQIHSLDVDRIGLGDLARREGYIARQLKRWYAQYCSARDEQAGPSVEAIDRVHAELVNRIPEQGPATVVHGDYRLDNTVIAADGTIVAVLDWELCTLGDPMADLAGLLAYWAEPGESSPLGASPTSAPGFPSRTEVAAHYAEVSGRDISQLAFYAAFAYWKLACILEGVYTRYVAGAMGDGDFDYSFYPDAIAALAAKAEDALGRLP